MRLGHVHLKVNNLARVEQFYSQVLQANVSERVGERYIFLSLGSLHHDIALQKVDATQGAEEVCATGLYHFAFELEGGAELLETLECLEQFGGEYRMVDHGISWAVYTNDPDGNGIEFYVDRRWVSGGRAQWLGFSKPISKETIYSAVSTCG